MNIDRSKLLKTLLIILVVKLTIIFTWSSFNDAPLTLDGLKAHHQTLLDFKASNPTLTLFLYASTVFTVTYLPVPSGSLLAFAGGSFLSFFEASLIYLVCYMFAVTSAFLTSRYILKDFFHKKYSQLALRIDNEIRARGDLYLLSLRFAPIIPSFIINYVMGITIISRKHFFFLSGLGRIPLTLLYVYSGQRVANVNSLDELITTKILALLVSMAILPWILNFMVKLLIKSRKTSV